MGKTLLKMQISTTTMVLDGKETIRKGKKQTRSCAGNVVQVFGFKNNFPGEAGYMEFPENFLCPTKGHEKPQSKLLKTSYAMR